MAHEEPEILFNRERLSLEARELARGHRGHLTLDKRHLHSLGPSLAAADEVLLETYRILAAAARQDEEILPAGEWILDNFYIIREQSGQIQEHLPASYYRKLPRLTSGPCTGYPRVYELVHELAVFTDNILDESNLSLFLKAYQEEDPLTLSELWAVPIMARFVLVRHLEERARALLADRRTRMAAGQWVTRILEISAEDPGRGLLLMQEMSREEAPLDGLFLTALARGLNASVVLSEPQQRWLDAQFEAAETTRESENERIAQRQTQQQVSVGNAVLSLRQIAEADWSAFVEDLSLVEQTLREDPSGIYPDMDAKTRNRYRTRVEHLCEYSEESEFEIAGLAIQLATQVQGRPVEQHVGRILFGESASILEREVQYRPPPKQRYRRFAYEHDVSLFQTAIVLFTMLPLMLPVALAAAAGASPIMIMVVLAATFLPALDLSVAFTNWLVTHTLPPRVLPRMEFRNGIPADHQTLVAVPVQILSPEQAREQVAQLEIRALANPDPALKFALLTGFPDAPRESMPQDEGILEAAVLSIRNLNKRYPGTGGDRFFLLHRGRSWNPVQGVWMELERKRGKLEELNRFLRNARGPSTFTTIEGNFRSSISGGLIQYVITLDADTQLPPGSAADLVRTAAHPLNQPVVGVDQGRVVRGYGVLQPRISILPEAVLKTPFTRLFSGAVGVDPYTTAVSDAYQDLFSEGIYTGKGLYHVDAFRDVLEETLPENTVLSHDLLEGNYARAALVTDIELFDDYPTTYLSYSKRQHRWIRGDWQILQWLFPMVPSPLGRRPNPLTAIGRWKIFDNLRRSLTPPALVLFLLLGWIALPGSPYVWTALALLVLSFPIFADVTSAVVRRDQEIPPGRYLHNVVTDLRLNLARTLLAITFLPHQAFISIDAVSRTLNRLFVTRKNTLEWVTASQAEQDDGSTLTTYMRSMWASPATSVLAAAGAALLAPQSLSLVLPVTLLWLIAPYVAWRIGRPIKKEQALLREEDVRFLKMVARRTWAYFDRYMGPESRWLPPDNVQVEPWRGAAPRTSPTNMGMALLSIQAAFDMGFLTHSQHLARLSQAIGSMNLLDRYRGHFYNWYTTDDGSVLPPRYVSSVDSGNLAASLLTLKQALLETPASPWPSPSFFDGLSVTLDVVEEEITLRRPLIGAAAADGLEEQVVAVRRTIPSVLPTTLGAWGDALVEPRRKAFGLIDVQLPATSEEQLVDLRFWLKQPFEQLESLQKIFRTLFQAFPDPAALPLAVEEASTLQQLLDALLNHGSVDTGVPEGVALINNWIYEADRMAVWCDEQVTVMDFRFLYDAGRGLFSIGFNGDRLALDMSTYDLFASEARIVSYLAIAKGDVPPLHWFQLGRRMTEVDGSRVLVSWSGTMFEYLMPLLFMRRYDDTLLDETYDTAVRVQRIGSSGRGGRPWGSSESGYFRLNLDMDYQYRAFGAPELGLKRGLAEDQVIAPYATMLALAVEPSHAVQNLRQLQREGAYGSMGFYEAVDYTKERLPRKQKRGVVYSYMAHHQGMGLLSIYNLLSDNKMQLRFHADPLVRSSELLLQERLPRVAPTSPIHSVDVDEEPSEEHVVDYSVEHIPRERLHEETPLVHVLSNGHFRTMISAAGGGFSAYETLALTAWRADRICDSDGSFLYVRDIDRGTQWTMGYQPGHITADRYDVWFHPNKVEMARVDDWIETFMEVCVSPMEPIELRRYTLTNYSEQSRRLELTSYAEVVLNEPSAHAAHPAFSKLFLQTEFVPEHHALLVHRRTRELDAPEAWLVHVLAREESDASMEPRYETDRARFIGRGRTTANPHAMDPGVSLSQTVGNVLDPIVSMRHTIELDPGQKVRVTFGMGAARSREEAQMLADQYDSSYAVDRAFNLARVYGLIQLQNLDITPEKLLYYHSLAGALFYGNPLLRASEHIIAKNRGLQSDLWPYGISGDHPLIVIRVSDREALPAVRTLLKIHAYWRWQGIRTDLAILNEHPVSYVDELQNMLVEAVEAATRHTGMSGDSQVFVFRLDQIPQKDLDLFYSVARIVLDGALPDLVQLSNPTEDMSDLAHRRAGRSGGAQFGQTPPPENTFSSFVGSGEEVVIELAPDGEGLRHPPLPWSNVIANESFGFLATESGSGYTWSKNSRENRLTPWSNDPVVDPPGEALYVRDEDECIFWSPTPGPLPGGGTYYVRHGQGYTTYSSQNHDLKQEVCLFVAPDAPVKIITVNLKNQSDRRRKLSLFRYQQWVLGVFPQTSGWFVVTEHDDSTGAILATNHYNNEFAGRTAFAAVIESPGGRTAGFTGDRASFLGRHGRMDAPIALRSQDPLDGKTGAGLDPCSAFQVAIDLAPGASWTGGFLLGEAEQTEEARNLIERFQSLETCRNALHKARRFWTGIRETIQIETPVPAINQIMSGWMMYQNLCCRIWARSAFYQSGGAFGFRDQLQDASALVYVRPDLTRKQILLHAAHQFVEGDVLHWWHPPTGRGIRTRFSDDLLWLPFVTAYYIRTTGDRQILEESAPFLTAPLLGEGEDEVYLVPESSQEVGSLLEHCLRAIDRSLTSGRHGLPLMGSGDWNDGMNRVGHKGQGESVWLGFFLFDILGDFIALGEDLGQAERARRYRSYRGQLHDALNDDGWDGSWYRRAYYDDGTPLGSAENDECRIDALVQAWSVLSGGAPAERAAQAMEAVETHLISEESRIIRLLTPPFDRTEKDPGYIKGYVPGVRENGGQYTHAALWVIAAFAKLGQGDRAGKYLEMISPACHTATAEGVQVYKAEPYVIAADVYGVEPHLGRGGWTWYTGSAGWMARVVIESLFGFRIDDGRDLVLNPCFPSDWEQARFVYRTPDSGSTYDITINNPDGVQRGVVKASLDQVPLSVGSDGVRVSLSGDGGIHSLDVTLGQNATTHRPGAG